MTAEKAHNSVNGGETGSILAGLIASSLIGAVYLAPIIAAYTAISVSKKHNAAATVFKASWLKAILIALGAITAIMTIGVAQQDAGSLSITTAMFVVLVAASSAIALGLFVPVKMAEWSKRIREF